ncbi:hypothetical protein Q8791_13305 [Nocardiopsis sp. CT-R113]|uniref:Uncharacterized protein n=1 Tax=Nocardiopsis codii TaxID=3065942 RepID=A0ABU7K7I4_9ACTN|nr:hypothetical protein [Nocardiopsis sp. CT-R113]MEE2038196.1 hypothetical protein [Nocardiopsis sp. CT-R113]
MSPFARPAPRRGHLSEHAQLLQCVQGIQERSVRAVPWEPDTVGIPDAGSDSALARINDVAFYANARDEVTALAGVCADLLRLHRPEEQDEPGGHHCLGCRLPWPCTTFGELSRLLG